MTRHSRTWQRTCLYCGCAYLSAHRDGKYCCEQCSQYYARRKKAFIRILSGIRTVEREAEKSRDGIPNSPE